MKVTQLSNGKTYDVHRYKNVLYIKKDSSTLPYYILELSNKKIEDIATGYEYTYYKCGNELYTGFYSNTYKSFAKENEQLELFSAKNYF